MLSAPHARSGSARLVLLITPNSHRYTILAAVCLLFSLALQPVLQELADSRAPGGLELVFSYLDDLCLAGDGLAVSNAVDTLKTRCNDIGLKLSTGLTDEAGKVLSKDKCELILTSCASSTVDVTRLPSDFKIVRDGNFELLGGPVGSPQFCEQHASQG